MVLLTATPRNSRARDILNQIRLFNADAMYAIYEGDGKRLEAIEDDMDKQVDLEVQEAEDLLRRIKRQQPELFARITSLPNAIRTAKLLGNAGAPPAVVHAPADDKAVPGGRDARARPAAPEGGCAPLVVFFFGQAGGFQRLWLADAEGNIVAEDNHTSLAFTEFQPSGSTNNTAGTSSGSPRTSRSSLRWRNGKL